MCARLPREPIDDFTEISLIPLPSPSSAPTSDCPDWWSPTFGPQTASKRLDLLSRRNLLWTKYFVIRAQQGREEDKTSTKPSRVEMSHRPGWKTDDHSSNSRQAFFHCPHQKKCQGRVSNNCRNPGDEERRGNGRLCSLKSCWVHLVLTTSLQVLLGDFLSRTVAVDGVWQQVTVKSFSEMLKA